MLGLMQGLARFPPVSSTTPWIFTEAYPGFPRPGIVAGTIILAVSARR